MTPKESTKLDAKAQNALRTQSYEAKPKIEGVIVHDLRRIVDESGDLQELARLTQGTALAQFPGFQIRQITHSSVEPGAVKAWHLHLVQDDVWFVPPSERLLVGLLDARAEFSTRGQTMRLVLGAGRSQLLFIPHGVAHGAANLSDRTVSLLYFTNQVFDPKKPDEHRLPPDHAGADFWERRRE